MHKENKTSLFTPHNLAEFAVVLERIQKDARWVPLFIVWIGILTLLQLFVGYVEWEIAYQVFNYVSADEGYYSAEVMAFTGVLMIIGFHLFAHNKPDNIAVRIVSGISAVMIPFYALGLGLLVMAILFGDGLSEMIATPIDFSFGETVETIKQNWLNWVFEYIANPSAILIFALAAGGLAIVNLFISHHLITAITNGVATVYKRSIRSSTAKCDYKIIMESQARFLGLVQERQAISHLSDHVLVWEVSAETLVAIQDGLAPHKTTLKQLEYAAEPSEFVLQDFIPPDPKQLSKDITKIDGITAADIFNALDFHSDEELT